MKRNIISADNPVNKNPQIIIRSIVLREIISPMHIRIVKIINPTDVFLIQFPGIFFSNIPSNVWAAIMINEILTTNNALGGTLKSEMIGIFPIQVIEDRPIPSDKNNPTPTHAVQK